MRTGDAKATPAFNLDPPVRHVIHSRAVWDGSAYDEADTLASCCRRRLEVADQLQVHSIAWITAVKPDHGGGRLHGGDHEHRDELCSGLGAVVRGADRAG